MKQLFKFVILSVLLTLIVQVQTFAQKTPEQKAKTEVEHMVKAVEMTKKMKKKAYKIKLKQVKDSNALWRDKSLTKEERGKLLGKVFITYRDALIELYGKENWEKWFKYFREHVKGKK